MKIKSILTTAVFILIIGGFLVLNRIITPPEISLSERRKLDTMPELTVSTLVSAKFMGDFEDYAADSFAFRDGLRSVRAFSVLDVFRLSDKSGLYVGDSGAGKFEAINEKSYLQVAEKIKKVAELCGEQNYYVSVIPDKSIYAGKYLPGFDYALAKSLISGALPEMTYIDLSDALNAGDYYKTDLHWDQSRLIRPGGALDTLLPVLSGSDRSGAKTLPQLETAGEFQGVYAGQLALPLPRDIMSYIPAGPEIHAFYLNDKTEKMEERDVYRPELFSGGDPYDFFLGGPQALITLTNTASSSSRTLYIFRDSFTSSLAPLIASSNEYSTVVLIDLRYLDSRVLPLFVDIIPANDVLFLYSSQVMNNPAILNVN